MGFKTVLKNIWKFIWGAAFAIVAIIGICMILSSQGWGIEQGKFGPNNSTVLAWGIGFTVIGLVFGVFPLFGMFKTLIKFGISIVGVLVFAWGICATLTCYVDTISIPWATLPADTAKWASIVVLLVGLFLGVIPFCRIVKKFFGGDEKPAPAAN